MVRFRRRIFQAVAFFTLLAGSLACSHGYQVSQQPQGQPIAVTAATGSDAAFEQKIAPYKARLDSAMNVVIGYAPAELTKKEWESTLGNFVVDLMMVQARLYTKEPLDLAVTTNGGLRNPLPKGNVTVGHVYELMPFENELVVVKVKGSTLQKLFNLAAAKKTVPMANVSYTIQGNRPFDIKIGGAPLNPSQTYAVVISDYLANGGDNMQFFKDGEEALILGITVRQAILNHIQTLTAAGQPVAAQLDGRVQLTD